MQIIPLGESALIVRLGDPTKDAPQEVLREVLAARERLEAAGIPAVIECAPAYGSLGVFFDRAQLSRGGESYKPLTSQIVSVLETPLTSGGSGEQITSHVIPVCFEPEFALDLVEVAQHAAFTAPEVVQRYCAGEYRVHAIGFLPGFPYLGGLLPELATPRRASPRKKVAAGSVAIGSSHTGIYPCDSPGGWNVIGRTPLRLFDVRQEQPALLGAGDQVQFRSISLEEFEAVWAEENAR